MTQPIARIQHPQKPDQWVDVRMPRAIERHEHERNADRLVRPIAVTRPDGTVPLEPRTKQPYVYIQHDRPSAEMICDTIWKSLTGWNLKDRTGASVKFEKDNVSELFEDHLDAEVTRWFAHVHAKDEDAPTPPVECRGDDCREPGDLSIRDTGDSFEFDGVTVVPYQKMLKLSYAVFLNGRIWDKKTFDPDPLA